MNVKVITPQELIFLRDLLVSYRDEDYGILDEDRETGIELIEALLERTEDVEIPEDTSVGC